MKSKAPIILFFVILFAFILTAYVVDETEQVVITQFGKAIGEPKTDPGLNFKIPIIQKANYFPKNLLEWDGEKGQVPTLDKTFIWVDTFARWKIVDPLKFFQTAKDITGGLARLDDIIDPAVRNFITSYPLIETVRMTNRELDTSEIGLDEGYEKRVLDEITIGRQGIIKGIMDQARPKLQAFGIELVDVKIKRVNYVEEVQKSVFARMIAERNQIAEKFRSEGNGEARKIEGNQERDLKQITSEAYKTAQEIKGKSDAEAARIYARAYSRDADFYTFVKTLDVYRETIDKDSSLILSTDSDFLKFFKGYLNK
jgi:membrane protease subunit HflC